MNAKAFFKLRLSITAIVTIAIWSLLCWEYYHGGVPTHHLLHRSDMPGLSNWWGGVLIPLVTWLVLYRVQQNIRKNETDFRLPKRTLYAFAGAFAFGILLSVFFLSGNPDLPFYLVILLFATALFFPIYRAECSLGFVLGMTYTFGTVLPLIIISVFSLIGAILYLAVRPAILYVGSGIIAMVSSKKL